LRNLVGFFPGDTKKITLSYYRHYKAAIISARDLQFADLRVDIPFTWPRDGSVS